MEFVKSWKQKITHEKTRNLTKRGSFCKTHIRWPQFTMILRESTRASARMAPSERAFPVSMETEMSTSISASPSLLDLADRLPRASQFEMSPPSRPLPSYASAPSLLDHADCDSAYDSLETHTHQSPRPMETQEHAQIVPPFHSTEEPRLPESMRSFLKTLGSRGHSLATAMDGFSTGKDAAGSSSSSDPSPLDELLKLLTQGFYPKNLLQMASEEAEQEDPLDTLIYNMKKERAVFLSTDMDKYRKIFKKRNFWYFIPALCDDIKSNSPPSAASEGKDCIRMEFALIPTPATKPMPWLIGLLYEFCFPVTIVTSPNLSTGSVGDVEMRLEISPEDSKCNISIYWLPECLRDGQHAAIVSESILKVIETHHVPHRIVEKRNIWQINAAGSKTAFDIQEASNSAAKSWNKQMEDDNDKRLQSKHVGKTQLLMKAPPSDDEEDKVLETPPPNDGVVDPLSSPDGSQNSERLHSSNSYESGYHSLPHDSQQTMGSERKRKSTDSGQNMVRDPEPKNNNQYHTQAVEKRRKGTTNEELGILSYFLRQKCLAYFLGDEETIFGNGTLVEFDNESLTGRILMACHVYQNLKDNNFKAKLIFPNCREPQPTHTLESDEPIRSSDADELDYAIVGIKPIGGTRYRIEPLHLDVIPPIDWTRWHQFYVITYPHDNTTGVIHSMSTDYLPSETHSLATLVLELKKGQMENGLTEIGNLLQSLPHPEWEKLETAAKNQVERFHNPVNQEDKNTGVELLRRIPDGAKSALKKDMCERGVHEAEFEVELNQKLPREVCLQLRQLLDSRRFLISNGGMSWGDSGAIIISMESGNAAPVGVFLCGYPQPTSEDFRAKHFKIMQGLKYSNVEFE